MRQVSGLIKQSLVSSRCDVACQLKLCSVDSKMNVEIEGKHLQLLCKMCMKIPLLLLDETLQCH